MYLGGLCFITQESADKQKAIQTAAHVLQAGARWVQYRDKDSSRRRVYENAVKLRKLVLGFNAALIINDYPDIALAVEAYGVHLGQDDLPIVEARRITGRNMIIGISTHSLGQALEAEEAGADYIGYGPVFHTTTKEAGEPKGAASLKEIKKHINIPVVAIGGITHENLRSVFDTGADAVAVSSAILRGDIKENTHRFIEIIKTYGLN